jgi:hypothetical protein
MAISGWRGEVRVIFPGVRFHGLFFCESAAPFDAGRLRRRHGGTLAPPTDLPCRDEQRLPRGEALGNHGKEVFVGTSARQAEADAPGVAPDDGTDLEQLEADGANLGRRQLGARQGQPPDSGQLGAARSRRNWFGHHWWHEVRSAKSSNCSLIRFSMSPRTQ